MNDSSDTWLQSQLFKNDTQQSTISEVTEPEPVLDFYKRERERERERDRERERERGIMYQNRN